MKAVLIFAVALLPGSLLAQINQTPAPPGGRLILTAFHRPSILVWPPKADLPQQPFPSTGCADWVGRTGFVSTHIAKKGADAYAGTFNLTLKGVTRPVQVPFTFVRTGSGMAGTFAGSFTINRVDYGVGKTSFLLSNDVTINLKIDV